MWDIFENTCDNKLTNTADAYLKGANSLGMGVGGTRRWTFDTLLASANYIRGETCEVVFVYKRPWLSRPDSDADKKTVFVTIN